MNPLGKLTKKADLAAENAAALVAKAIRGIRAELALLAEELNIAGSAKDRDKVYAMIQSKMAELSKRLDRLMRSQNELAGKTAAKTASEMTGIEVKFSAKRAEAITQLVTPAQGENLAAVFTQNMAQRSINALQEATVAVMREQAVEGGTLKEMGKALGKKWTDALKAPPVFTDAGGNTWDTQTYLQMNIRTNTMRVYNDCLVDDIARSTGEDFVRVSRGGDPMCKLCAPWEGVILSISGKTKGFPSYEQARAAGCFHPNCVHTLEYTDEIADEEEFEIQRKFPATDTDPESMDERRYKIDQERYRRKGMTKDAARLAVDRDNLADNIRHGLVRDDAREIVDKLTDAQITALCKDGNPPRFTPTKKATKKDPHAADEKFIRSKRGGVVHIKRDAGVEDLVRVARLEEAKQPAKAPVPPAPTVAEVRTDYIREIMHGVPDGQMKHLGNTFETAPTEVLRRIAAAKSSTSFDSRKGAYCEYGSSPVHLSPREGWSNNPSALAHEKGHAVLNSLGQKSCDAVQERFAAIATAAQIETAAWAEKTFGKNWKSQCRPSNGAWYTEIGKRVFGFSEDVLTGHTPQMCAASAVSDIFSAATQGRQFFGHDSKYYKRGEARPTHEITANVTSLLCGGYLEQARSVLPKTIAAVERAVYGISHKSNSSADASRTKSS